ncbi:hypothetical protein G7054_g5605 [Neopestalotiopsis clavispora]|nr:hypothetical protein G7054_g5605 [Neopestalotiopsis clavispora]
MSSQGKEARKVFFAIAPTLPVANPTTSAWQEPPHATIAELQSAQLPEEVDVVIIGSGITGCSAANTLLAHPQAPGLRVAILEARNAVSGATGRNGGHLISDVAIHYTALVDQLGSKGAIEIARFSERNVQALGQVVAGLDEELRQASEFRHVVGTHAFAEQEEFEECMKGIESLEKDFPETTLKHTCAAKGSATETHQYKDFAGVTEQRFSGTLWPYRLIAGILDQLLQKHKGNFHLETNTPVLHVEFLSEATGSFPYSLRTPRGTIRAKHVIHCTNGYSGRLIPGLVGRMFPLKGTMSVQGPGPNFPRLGAQTSWSYRWKPGQIPGTEEWSSGLFYCQQNAHTGDFWIGGETQTWDELLTSDDSFVGQTAEKNLTAVLPKMFKDVEPVEIKKVWSGIMGFLGMGFRLLDD